MIANHAPACSCCGTPTLDEKRIDVRFGLPDVALEVREEARHEVGVGALLRVDGVGCFMRCLLPVRLTDDIELVFGTWLEISDAELDRAHTIWNDPAYADLTLRGALANSIKPWGDGLLGATATVEVSNPDEIPYVVTSDQHLLAHVLAGTWDRHDVLSCLGHPLPVAVRTHLDEHWSIERTAGLAARVVEGTSQFAAPGRNVQADLFSGSADDSPEEFLASLLVGAPTVPSDQQLTEQIPDGVRHAFWLTSGPQGHERHELYGFTVHNSGTGAGVYCTWDAPEDLPWAQHVWRSLHRSTEDETRAPDRG
ncbi:DUF2199 domain-containing protein [Streptomyces sp. NBC_00658]|uniref:DUF2199 domain-containing protein n=1 Tax=Streptomyces sp. NBC_00658 TaxID=2975800 RepID=UPI00324DD36B